MRELHSFRALGILTVALLVVGLAFAATQYSGLAGVFNYNNGYILSWNTSPVTRVALYTHDGKLAYSVSPQKGDSSSTTWALDSDGVVASAYGLLQPREGRIDLLDSTGNVTGKISTGSYIPCQVVFAPDHTIWTASFDANNDGTQDFNVLHHYARTGQELGQTLLWSQLSDDFTHP